ncbi:MAG: M16 family metallopeptidase [Planctomycetota bacterium]|jgi:zinc protease
MQRRAILYSLILAALSMGCGPAPIPAPPFVHEGSDLAPDGQAVFGKLKNGMRYVIYPNKEPKNRLFAYLRIDAGSLYETDAQQGVAHFLEHMAFNGSTNFAPGELVKYFQSIGMDFGGDVNAFTSIAQTAYSLDLPNTKPETLKKGFLLLADYARRLSLTQKEIDRERGIILAEMRDRDTVRWRMHKARLKFVYDNALLSQRMPIGVKSTLKAVNKPLFDDFYHTWYRPERMTLILVGDTSAEAILPLVEQGFGALSATAPSRPVPSPGEFDHDGVKAFHLYEGEAENVSVELFTSTRIDPIPDTVARQQYETARDIGESILNRRLDKLAKKEGAVFHGGGAYSYKYLDWTRHAGLRLAGTKENWEAMVGLAEQELRRALEHGFTQAELREAKARFLRRLDEAALKAPTRNSRRLAGTILDSLERKRVFMAPTDRKSLLTPFVKGLTHDSILSAFRRAWEADHRLVLVFGNADLGKDAETRILTAYRASSGKQVKAKVAEATKAFAYGKRPKEPGKIEGRQFIKGLGIHRVDFANGLRLNLKKTDFKKGEVRIQLRFGQGLSAQPKGQPGLAQWADMTYVAGGLKQHSADELSRILADKALRRSFRTTQRHFVLGVSAVPKDLETGLQLLRATYLEPGFREEAFRVARKQLDDHYGRMEHSADGARRLKVERLLASGDERFGLPDRNEMMKRTRDQVKAWLTAQRNFGPLELSIVGDVEIEPVVKWVGAYFGGLPAVVKAEPVKQPVRFPAPGSHTFTVPTKIERGQLLFYWKTTDQFRDIHRTRRLGLVARVFDEYLREEVREKIGGAYSPYAGHWPSSAYEDYGYFIVLVNVDPKPEAVAKIREAVLDIAKRLHGEGTTEELFGRVKAPLASQLEKYRRTNGYWMNVLAGSQRRPEQLEWSRSFIQDHADATLKEINAYAKQYLDPAKAVVVTILPEKK